MNNISRLFYRPILMCCSGNIPKATNRISEAGQRQLLSSNSHQSQCQNSGFFSLTNIRRVACLATGGTITLVSLSLLFPIIPILILDTFEHTDLRDLYRYPVCSFLSWRRQHLLNSLEKAIIQGDSIEVKSLLKKIQFRSNEMPLLAKMAAENNQWEIVKLFIEHAQCPKEDRSLILGRMACLAIKKGEINFVKDLIERGFISANEQEWVEETRVYDTYAEPDIAEHTNSLLFTAFTSKIDREKKKEIVKYLLDKGADFSKAEHYDSWTESTVSKTIQLLVQLYSYGYEKEVKNVIEDIIFILDRAFGNTFGEKELEMVFKHIDWFDKYAYKHEGLMAIKKEIQTHFDLLQKSQ